MERASKLHTHLSFMFICMPGGCIQLHTVHARLKSRMEDEDVESHMEDKDVESHMEDKDVESHIPNFPQE